MSRVIQPGTPETAVILTNPRSLRRTVRKPDACQRRRNRPKRARRRRGLTAIQRHIGAHHTIDNTHGVTSLWFRARREIMPPLRLLGCVSTLPRSACAMNNLDGGLRRRLPKVEMKAQRSAWVGRVRICSARDGVSCFERGVHSAADRNVRRHHDLAGRTVVREIGITPIPLDRPPFRRRTSKCRSTSRFSRAGQRLQHQASGPKGAQLVYPNYRNLATGIVANFWLYDPDVKDWYVCGPGVVKGHKCFRTRAPGSMRSPGRCSPPFGHRLRGGRRRGGGPLAIPSTSRAVYSCSTSPICRCRT